MARDRDTADIGALAALEEGERAGLALALTIRSVMLAALIAYSILSQVWPQGLVGASMLGLFLALGLLLRQAIVFRRDAPWMRYAFFAFDALALAVLAVTMPVTTGGDVPQIFVFRAFGPDVLYFLIATAALSMSPSLVLWAGGCSVAALWGAFGTIVYGMERTVSWVDLPPSAPTEVFMELFLDPDFIATGTRNVETAMLLGVSAIMAGAVWRARGLLRRQVASERARSAVAEVFGRFVPQEVTARLAASGGTLPPADRVASVLFIDIEGFTRFAEGAAPERVITALDGFFDRVNATVGGHNGVVISLIGDAALVAFNAPLDNPTHARDAIAAAQSLLETDPAVINGFRLRIGIATGRVAAGTVGGQGRRAYTLYGDTVNLAQRLEAMNKDTASRLMVDVATWAAAGEPPGFERLPGRAVRGRGEAVDAYAFARSDAVARAAEDGDARETA
ncbi:MAG: adenylate/guanylate cyclase domain-containing protein [Pseudomonadota bacterium]